MARDQLEVCMFCQNMPCQCNKPAPKKKLPASPKQDKPIVVPFASSVQGRVGLAGSNQIKDSDSDDIALRDALRCFARAQMMSVDDMIKYEKVMNLSQVEFRTLLWKQRRATCQQ